VAAVLCLAGVAAPTARAIPDLRRPRPAGALTFYADDRRGSLFYYGPGEIALAADADGRPDLRFLEARYTGTAAGGDAGRQVFRSVLSLRVVQTGVDPAGLAAARAAARLGAGVELRPLPIQRLEAVLAYTPLRPDAAAAAAPDAGDAGTALPGGYFEEERSPDRSVDAPFWTERTYVLGLSPEEAQLFGDSLRRGRLVLSLAYAFLAKGALPEQAPLLDLRGPREMREALRQRVAGRGGSDGAGGAKEAPVQVVLVRAGATALEVDAQRWPDLFRRIDINESLPPGYAALEVYCYDFHDALRPDLYEKQVEIEATSVTGKPVTLAASFGAGTPELYARSLRFPVAVRFDRPYRYRVAETGVDGQARPRPWVAASSWSRILDLTSPPEEQTARPSAEDQP
jgi:hypothetical protein